MNQNTIRVLLLDDDPNLREVLGEILKVKGYEPISVDTGAAALARIEQRDIDVVLIDIKLKDMSGLEVLQGVKTRSPDTECIMLTGHASQTTAIDAINLGAFSYFQKPYGIDQLLLAIRRAAEKHASGHALLENAARFRSLIENSSDLIAILGPDATLRYISPSIQRLMGYPIQDVTNGIGLQEFIHPDDLPAFIEAFQQCIQAADSRPISLQLRLRHQNGTWRTLEGIGRNLLDDPAIQGIIINARDVTERVRTEGERHALQEIMQGLAATENLQELLQFIHHSIAKIIYAENFFVIFYNKSTGLFEEVFSIDKYDAPVLPSRLEHSISSYVFRTGLPLLLTSAGLEELVARGEVEVVGTRQAIWLGVPLKTPGETIGVMAVQNYEDPHCYSERDREFFASVGSQVALAIGRRQADEQVRVSRERYRSLFEDSPISLWEQDFSGIKCQLDALRKQGVKDFDRYLRSHPQLVAKCAASVRVLDVNKATLDLYQAGSKQDLLQGLSRVIQDDAFEKFREELVYIAEGKTQFDWEGVNQTLDGKRLDIRLSFAVAPGYESDLSKVIISVVDVTERKQAEAALRKSESSLQAILQSTADGILAIGTENEVLYFNDCFSELWRIPQDVLNSRDDSVLLQFVLDQLSNPQGFLQKVQGLYHSRDESFDTLDFKDGRIFERLSQPLLQGDNITGRVWSFRDVTERKHAEQRLTALNECFLKFGADPPANINLLVAYAGEILGATCAIYNQFLGDMLTSTGSWNTPPDYRSVDNAAGHICTDVIRSDRDEIVLIRNLQDTDYARTDQNVKQYQLQTYFGKPVRFESTNTGSLCVVFQKDFIPSQDDKRLLGIISSAIGVEEKRKREALLKEVLYQVLNAVSIQLDSDLVVRSAVETICILTGYPHVCLALPDESGANWVVRGAAGRLKADLGATHPTHKGIIGRAFKTREKQWVRDILEDPAYVRDISVPGSPALRSELVILISRGERLFGALNIESDRPDAFDQDDVRLFQSVADVISLALEKAQLYGEARQEIIRRTQAEEQIRLSEERYRMLAENMSDTVWLMDISLRTTYISPSVTRLRGFTLEELNAIPLDHQMPPDSLQRALRMFAETLSPENLAQTGQPDSRTIELEFYKKDGSRFWSENTFTLIRDLQGQPLAIMGSGRDITARKQAEHKLKESEKYFRLLTENNTDAVVLIDPRGMILYESPAYGRMMGRPAGQRIGQSGFEFVHPEDKIAVAHTVTELSQDPGGIRKANFRVQHSDGSWRWFEATATNLLGESAIHGLVINIHDITERKQSEEEIRRRVADLEVLYEHGLNISVLLEPDKIARTMIEILSQKLDWHHATIRLYHPETRCIEVLAVSEPGLEPAQAQAELVRLNKIFTTLDVGLSGWAIKHGQTIRTGDVQSDKRYHSTFSDIRSGLYVPLMLGERALGCIAVESRKLDRFNEEDERLLKTLAAQSAIAFENARLYQEAVSAEKRKAALHQGGLEIVRAGQDINSLCIALHHATRQVMPAEFFIVSLITADGLEVEAPFMYDRGIRHPNSRLPVDAGITGRVIRSGKSLRLKDVQRSPGPKPIMLGDAKPTRAILSVPLFVRKKIIGVVSTQSSDPDVYTDEDQVFLETLASEAAVAFENARLFEELRLRLAELESLSQVSVSLTSAIDLEPLIANILNSARNAIPAAEKGTIFLIEPDGTLRLHAMLGYTDPLMMGLVLTDQAGYAARVARERTPIKIDDAHAEYDIPYHGTFAEIDAVLCGIAAPLIAKEHAIGVIALDNASRKTAFSDADLHLLVSFASSAAVAIENARLFSETQQRLLRISTLHSIDAAIGASVDTNVTLSIVLEHVVSDLGADAAAVLLLNPVTRMLDYSAGRGFRTHGMEGVHLRLGEGFAGQSALHRTPINIPDLQKVEDVQQALGNPLSRSGPPSTHILEGEGFVSYHAIPLIAKGQVQGVLEIFHRVPTPVDQEWISFFEMLAGQTAIAIDNGHLFENLQQTNLDLTLAYDATIQGWSQALELRDEETEGHTRRVTELTLRLLQAMGIDEMEIEHVRRGSLLHDIGKIAVPDSILLKAGPLDENEWKVMRQHPQYAYNLLNPIVYLRPAISIPYCHHEKWDGSGYPRGLKGDLIPIAARIFSIVDVYDALTSNRPYRLAWTPEKALDYIREQSGKHFDPHVVKAFLALMSGSN